MVQDSSRVYLDHAATSPLRSSPYRVMVETLRLVGNPSSLHQDGRKARMLVEQAREDLAETVGAHCSEVIFTSGGTEANNLALKGLFWSQRSHHLGRRGIVVAGIEHPAVLDVVQWLEQHEGAFVHWVKVNSAGIIDSEQLEKILKIHHQSIAVVSCMWANNEVGTIQDIPYIASLCEQYHVPFHTDAVQAFGSIPVNFSHSKATAMTLSSHKIGGPLGVGALLLKRNATLVPVQHGGGQERDVRSGTLDTPAVVAFAQAATDAIANLPEKSKHISKLRDKLIAGIEQRIPAAFLQGDRVKRLPHNVHFTFTGCEGDSLLFLLDGQGISSSTGSACTAGVPRPSHVLLSMGMDEKTARGAQRFSLGPQTSEADIDRVLMVIKHCYEQAAHAGLAAQAPTIATAGFPDVP